MGSIPQSEDPLEEDMAIHSSILAWRIPRTEEPGGLWSIGSDLTEATQHSDKERCMIWGKKHTKSNLMISFKFTLMLPLKDRHFVQCILAF